jgi:integrase
MPRKSRTKAANGAGTVYRDKSRRGPNGEDVYRVVVTMPDGRRRSERVVTDKRTVALARARVMAAEAATSTTGPARPPTGGRRAWTVGTWLAYWRETVVGNRKGRHGTGLSAASKRREAWSAAEITRALGERNLRALTPEDVETFLAARAHGIDVERRAWSAASCRDVRNLLARAYDEAIRRGHAPAPNPADVAEPGHARAAELRHALSAEECQRLFKAARANGTPAALVVALALTTGMRPGEAYGLQWGRVDMDARTLRIDKAKTPTGKRVLHLSAPALGVIREAAKLAGLNQRNAEAYVFPGIARSPHVTERNLIDTLKALCAEVGITVGAEERAPHPHELRHTFTSHLLDADVTPQKVAAILGDKIETVLRVYAHKIKPVAGEAEAVHINALYGAA